MWKNSQRIPWVPAELSIPRVSTPRKVVKLNMLSYFYHDITIRFAWLHLYLLTGLVCAPSLKSKFQLWNLVMILIKFRLKYLLMVGPMSKYSHSYENYKRHGYHWSKIVRVKSLGWLVLTFSTQFRQHALYWSKISLRKLFSLP